MFEWFKRLFGKKPAKTTETWGGSQVLWDTPFVKVTHIWVEPGQVTPVQTSQDFAMKQWLFFKGSGEYTLGMMKKKIIPGTNTNIQNGTKHFIAASNEKVEVLEVQSGEKVLQLPMPTAAAQLPETIDKP